ncbi:hypothetical protein Ac2012v2_000126 [Leucoagaricus gongylophorus]
MARPNEHLAVLLPRHLWKPDAGARYCDNFYCRVAFSWFERRHHCRKCGGVFCHACSPRTTTLLDTTSLGFLLPPHNVPITTYESPQSRVLNARVCDDCFDQIHGLPTTPRHRRLSHALTLTDDDHSIVSSSSLSSSSSPAFSTPCSSPTTTTSTTSNIPPALSRKSRTAPASPIPSTILSPQSHVLIEKSYGELDAYPLRRSSVLCKATGGGRWEPKQMTVLSGYRPPGGKAPFEIELEREEQEAKIRRLNPIVKDGDFQYRFPPQILPEDNLDWPSRGGPITFSTF